MRASRFCLKSNQIVKSSKVAQSQNLLSLFNCRLLTIDCRIRDIFFFWTKACFCIAVQLSMPSCQSSGSQRDATLKALETWSSGPLVVKQVFAFFSVLSIMSRKWLKYHPLQLPVSGRTKNVYLAQELCRFLVSVLSARASILMAPINFHWLPHYLSRSWWWWFPLHVSICSNVEMIETWSLRTLSCSTRPK